MDGDRKYKQNGYQQSDRSRSDGSRNEHSSPRPQGPKPSIDITGPRLPRLVQATAASRCNACVTTLPAGTDFKGQCPKCKADLHTCRQCSHFEPSTRFQCLKPIPERIPVKDKNNECAMFSPRVTVARDSAPAPAGPSQQASTNGNSAGPKNVTDARAMFDNLFKK
jgi:hypothetical protein